MNPYITKEQADQNMVDNLFAVQGVATGILTAVALKLLNQLGDKEDNLENYYYAKNKAYELGYINDKMGFIR